MNSEMNVFNPVDLDLSRSTFDMHPSRSGTLNAGRLCPVFSMEIYPGDSVKMDLRTLFKMSTPVYPTMDQLYADVFFYFVPNRLVLGSRYGNPTATETSTSWAAFIGAQDNYSNCPIPAVGNRLPYVLPTADIEDGSLLDYFVGNDNTIVGGSPVPLNALPFLSYFAIWNEDFRDPNTTQPVTWSVNGTTHAVSFTGSVPLYATAYEISNVKSQTPGTNYALVNALADDDDPSNSASDEAQFWLPFPVYRFHGYYGSCLPWPQRNTDGVELPLGDSAPVIVGDAHIKSGDTLDKTLRLWQKTSGGVAGAVPASVNLMTGGATSEGSLATHGGSGTTNGSGIVPANLWADLSQATAANVNALRAAIQKQRWYEKLARSGNRFDELEYGLFGVRPQDSGSDRPFLLGSKRIPLAVEMVASTNGASGGSLGNLGAFSHTNDQDHMFYHSFDEWGILQCVVCIRHHDTIASGLDRMWTRETRDDYYFPTFAHLGEQAVLQREINRYINDVNPFGYQEAWEDLRQIPDRVSGLLSPAQSLGYMTYAERFPNPTLASFLNASYQVETIDRTLQVASYSSGFQFVYQMTFDMSVRRCMPTYSIPGLMDHF